MPNDSAVGLLARERFITDSADIEAQLSITAGGQPIATMLMLARGEASAAITELVELEDPDLKQVRKLLVPLHRYTKLVEWLRTIMKAGFEFDREIAQQDRDELLDLLSSGGESGTERNELQEAIDMGIVERKPYGADA